MGWSTAAGGCTSVIEPSFEGAATVIGWIDEGIVANANDVMGWGLVARLNSGVEAGDCSE